MDLNEYRRNSLERWDRFSTNWDDERSFLWERTRPVSERIVDRLDPSEGDTVLELAAGTGQTSFLIADRLGGSGRVISTDFAPGMVEAARRGGEELGLQNFESRVLDAEKMDLADDSVDGVAAKFGYMLIADPAAALAETRRVLRDGGRLAFAVWAGADRNLWAAIPGITLIELGLLPPPELGGPGIFGMADTDRIRELVADAGFGEPSIEQVAVEWGYDDAEFHWEKTMKLTAPIADAVGGLSAGEQQRTREMVAERVAERLAEDSSALDGLVHVVSAA